MLNTTAFLTVLSLAVAQSDGLSLTNSRLTYGILGPTRADNKLLPGDSLFVAFDIEGITVGKDAKVHYTTTTEVSDGTGKVLHKPPPPDRPQEYINSLGGSTLPAFARIDVALNSPPGEYTLKVTVTDWATKKSASLTQKATVLPKAFGLVGLKLSSDPEGQHPAGLVGPGESLFVNSLVVGFARDKTGGQPHVELEMRVLDASGKPTLAKPFSGTVNKDVHARADSLPVQFLLSPNRAGRFSVELKATDKVTGKTVTQSFPITVFSSK